MKTGNSLYTDYSKYPYGYSFLKQLHIKYPWKIYYWFKYSLGNRLLKIQGNLLLLRYKNRTVYKPSKHIIVVGKRVFRSRIL